ncbi:MAG TPA: fibrobacter succinogenes major paralogous domain-containing protein, partial [Sphingobacterium sp.]|nr:fibrobacter succinogenes major paralogous domain-containing protein [Sphingobacterium sp.]
MKTFIYICLAFISITLLSCQKDNKKVTPRFLDVNIKFSGITKPNAGDVLVLNLHYQNVEGKPYNELSMGESQSIVLNQQQIEEGFRATFEEYPMEELIYLSAYIDIDRDGELGTGDFALFYPDITFNEVELGEKQPKNITKEYAVPIDMNVVIGGAAGGIVDIDGNVYETVIIGGQEWTKENLKVTHYNDGTPIHTGLSNSEWAATTVGAYAIYPYGNVEGIESSEEMVAKFGLLYNWYAVDNPKGLCPEGWRVPTDNDWKDLERTIGMGEEVNDAAWRGDKAAILMSADTWWV